MEKKLQLRPSVNPARPEQNKQQPKFLPRRPCQGLRYKESAVARCRVCSSSSQNTHSFTKEQSNNNVTVLSESNFNTYHTEPHLRTTTKNVFPNHPLRPSQLPCSRTTAKQHTNDSFSLHACRDANATLGLHNYPRRPNDDRNDRLQGLRDEYQPRRQRLLRPWTGVL